MQVDSLCTVYNITARGNSPFMLDYSRMIEPKNQRGKYFDTITDIIGNVYITQVSIHPTPLTKCSQTFREQKTGGYEAKMDLQSYLATVCESVVSNDSSCHVICV